MLELGDDLYLLRLVLQTGPVTKLLDKATARQVLFKLNKFIRAGRFEEIEIHWLNESMESGKFAELSENE